MSVRLPRFGTVYPVSPRNLPHDFRNPVFGKISLQTAPPTDLWTFSPGVGEPVWGASAAVTHSLLRFSRHFVRLHTASCGASKHRPIGNRDPPSEGPRLPASCRRPGGRLLRPAGSTLWPRGCPRGLFPSALLPGRPLFSETETPRPPQRSSLRARRGLCGPPTRAHPPSTRDGPRANTKFFKPCRRDSIPGLSRCAGAESPAIRGSAASVPCGSEAPGRQGKP